MAAFSISFAARSPFDSLFRRAPSSPLLFEGAHARDTGVGPDHAPLLAIGGHAPYRAAA
jgi:hypothetical protein